MQDTNIQDSKTQEKDKMTDADGIRYQVLLTSEESAYRLRNSVAGMSGIPLKGMGPGDQMPKLM